MKGKILNVTEQDGIILGNDNQRYKFSLSEWKENTQPKKGYEVDFEVENDNNAKNIYLISKSGFDIQNIHLSDIQSNIKMLGGIGAVLLLLSWIPYIGFILYIVGLVLLSIAIKKLSDKAPEKTIFTKWIISIVIGIVGVLLMGVALGGFLALIGSSTDNEAAAFGGMMIISLIGFIAIEIILGILYKQIFYRISEITGENIFRTAGIIFLIGGILSIIFIGYFLFFIGWILVAIGFFSMKTNE